VRALDYLLKPNEESRIFVALERARRLMEMKQQDALYQEASASLEGAGPSKRFAVRNGRDF